MYQMIRVIVQDGEGSVELLQKNDTREFMWQCHFAEREDRRSFATYFNTETIGTADGKEQRERVQLFALEPLGQFFRRKMLASRIQSDETVLLPLAFTASKREDSGFVFQRKSLDWGVPGETFQVVIGESLDGRFFGFAHPCDFEFHGQLRSSGCQHNAGSEMDFIADAVTLNRGVRFRHDGGPFILCNPAQHRLERGRA